MHKERRVRHTSFQPGSVFIFKTTQYRSDAANKSINGVPGVMALLSQAFLFFSSSVKVLPIAREYCNEIWE